MNNRNQLLRTAVVLIVATLCFAGKAMADFGAEFDSQYPKSTSGSAGCQLCHGSSTSRLNTYGRALQDALAIYGGGAANIFGAFVAVQPSNSDGDAGANSNLVEINANAQPGWTTGLNTTYPRNRVGATAQETAPIGIALLDPVSALPTITISASTPSASETGPTAGQFTVSRTGGTTSPLTVNYTIGGTATNTTDYASLSGSVIIGAGSATALITVTPVDDALFEGSETVILTLSANAAYTVGSPDNATVTIADNDPAPAGTLQFSASSYTVDENGGVAVITVTRTDGSSGAVSVTFATSDSTALSGSDYTAVLQTVNFGNGDTASKTVNISIINDGVLEPDETVNLTLSDATGGAVLGVPHTAVLTILANDMPAIVPVDCSGSSIQAALDNAAPGSTILVSGTCTQNVLVRNERQRITIDGAGAGAGTRATISGNSSSPAFNVRGKGILIQNFIISGGSQGVYVNRGSNAVLNNNVIQNSFGNGVLVDELAFAVLTNNTIQNHPGAGVVVSEASTARIGFNADSDTVASANTIQNNIADGIIVSNGSSARIIGNDVNSNGGDGIAVARDSHADIASNAISGNGAGGIELAENSSVQLGENTGASIFESPNMSASSNTGFGIHCSNGGVAYGRAGTLAGTSGAKNFPSGCIDSLL